MGIVAIEDTSTTELAKRSLGEHYAKPHRKISVAGFYRILGEAGRRAKKFS
jgi:hypothetical protein